MQSQAAVNLAFMYFLVGGRFLITCDGSLQFSHYYCCLLIFETVFNVFIVEFHFSDRFYVEHYVTYSHHIFHRKGKMHNQINTLTLRSLRTDITLRV